VEEKDFIIVGVNEFIDENEVIEPPKFKIDPKIEIEQREFLKEIKEKRDNILVRQKLEALKLAAERGDNLVPYIIDAVKVYATEQEIMETLKSVYGIFKEVVVI
jgi:methylmalonyl-CoA mutase N-terminal domain/subunit